MKTTFRKPLPNTLLSVGCSLCLGLLAAPRASGALPEGRNVAIQSQPDGLALHWQGIADAPYEIQATPHLRGPDWAPLGSVTALEGDNAFPVTLAASPSRFFRVLFPQPVVEAGEPAFASEAGGTVYITGQFFYPGDQIRVGGVPLTDVTFITPTLISATLPPSPPGLYGIDVVSGQSGGLLATLPAAIEVAPPLERTLLEPPEWPPAGPAPQYKKDFRGHVTLLKAFDDEEPPAAARGHTKSGHVSLLKAFDDETPGAAARPYRKTGHVTLLKAFDDEDASEARGIDKKDIRRTGINEPLPDVRLHSGETSVQTTDLALAGRGLDFAWTRTYRSRTGTNTTQGAGWAHAYDVSIQRLGGDILIHGGTGRRDLYRLQPDGTYACPGLFREGAFTNGAFRLTFADTGFWAFTPLDTSPAAGKLARIEDRNGNAITLSYDASGRLAQITDTLDRAHTVAYDGNGRIASVTDSTGRSVTYGYDGNGDLVTVTSPPVTGTPNGNDFPSGKTVAYTYTTGQSDPRANHLLLIAADGKGQTAVTCTYDLNPASASFRRVLAIQQGSAPAACLTYLPQTPSPDNRFAARRCIVNDPEGNVTESFFDLRNRCVLQREFTGRAVPGLPVTATENRPAGKLRPSDPDFYETRLSWNNDSLCTKLTLPSGLVGTFVHNGDANATARMRKRPELLYQAWDAKATGGADTDGDGAADLFKIETRYTYDPRFGSDPTPLNNMRDRINQLESQLKGLGLLARGDGDNTPIVRGSALGASAARIKPRGWDGTVKGSLRADGRDDDCDGFATSITDPRGTVTSAEYDARGNRLFVQAAGPKIGIGAQAPKASFAYDAYGQLTAITNAPDASGRRRVTSLGWVQGQLHTCVDDAAPGGLAVTTTVERDARGNITRCIDPEGNDTLETCNALGQLVTRSSPPYGDGAGQRVTTTLFYDENNNLTRVDTDNRRESGASVADNPAWTTRFDYDALDRCVAVVAELDAATAVTNRFAYDANGQLASHLSPLAASGAEPANRTDFAYDERGLLFRATRAPGTSDAATAEFAYTADGEPAVQTDAGEPVATYAYDGFGRPSSATDAGGNTVSWFFTAGGDLAVRRVRGETLDAPGGADNRRLAETRWTCDGLGRRTERVDAFFDVFTELAVDDGARTTSYAYAPNGQLASVTNDLGQITAYAYDTAGRLAAVSRPGSLRASVRDAFGSVLRVTQTDTPELGGPAQTFVTDFAYDALGRLTAAWDTVGNTNRLYYDSLSRVVRTADPRGNETRGRYDGLGQLTDAIAYVGPCDADDSGVDRGITINTTHVEYDVQGRVASVTDVNTNTVQYAYDVRNRPTVVTLPDATASHLVWSPRSNLTEERDANGTTVAYSYDPLNRLIRKDVTCGAGVEPTTTFEAFAYDGLSRLVSASNDLSQTAFAFDSLGNTVSTVQDGLTTVYSCDSLGNQRTCSCPSGYSIHHTYNPDNAPASVSVESGGVVSPVASFAYDGPGRLARLARSNGVSGYIYWNGLASEPNPPGDRGSHQVAAISHSASGGGVIDERVYAYDASQNKVLRAQTEPFAPGGDTRTNGWSHDALGRVGLSVSSQGTWSSSTAYALDGKGNRLAVTNNGATEVYTRDAALPEPADFQMDQYTATPAGSNTYDAAGNLLARESPAAPWFYHYDYAGRLVQVDGPDALGSISPVAAFGYDALGRRVVKMTFPSGLPPETTQFVYGDGRDQDCDGLAEDPVLETRKGGAVSSVSVLSGAGGGAAAAAYAATGRMLAPPVAVIGGAGEILFTHTDDLGSVLALSDAGGSVVERYEYDDFGSPAFLAADGSPLTDSMGLPASSSPAGNPYLFRGMQWDGETGLYIDGTPKTPTYYDAKTGQLTTRKCIPWCSGGGEAARTFANNSPWTLGKEEGGRHTPFFNRTGLKTRFENGDVPTEEQFGDLIDSILVLEAAKRIGASGNDTMTK